LVKVPLIVGSLVAIFNVPEATVKFTKAPIPRKLDAPENSIVPPAVLNLAALVSVPVPLSCIVPLLVKVPAIVGFAVPTSRVLLTTVRLPKDVIPRMLDVPENSIVPVVPLNAVALVKAVVPLNCIVPLLFTAVATVGFPVAIFKVPLATLKVPKDVMPRKSDVPEYSIVPVDPLNAVALVNAAVPLNCIVPLLLTVVAVGSPVPIFKVPPEATLKVEKVLIPRRFEAPVYSIVPPAVLNLAAFDSVPVPLSCIVPLLVKVPLIVGSLVAIFNVPEATVKFTKVPIPRKLDAPENSIVPPAVLNLAAFDSVPVPLSCIVPLLVKVPAIVGFAVPTSRVPLTTVRLPKDVIPRKFDAPEYSIVPVVPLNAVALVNAAVPLNCIVPLLVTVPTPGLKVPIFSVAPEVIAKLAKLFGGVAPIVTVPDGILTTSLVGFSPG
jgi:hypothetical protein